MKNSKIKAEYYFILIYFLFTACKSDKVDGLLTRISGTHRGKLIVYFNEPEYLPLKKVDNWYCADIRNKSTMKTSTSFNIVDESYIKLVNILDEDSIDYQYIGNNALWYSGKDTKNLRPPYTNKEFFIAYIYRDKFRNNRSRDSLVNFLKSINGDTSHIH